MLKHLLSTCLLVTSVSVPVFAATPQKIEPRSLSQAQPTSEELYQACTQNRAETLPNPFTDVSPNHWAFKAVLTMHYCGAFRQAAPRSLFNGTAPAPTPSQSSTPNSQSPMPLIP